VALIVLGVAEIAKKEGAKKEVVAETEEDGREEEVRKKERSPRD
jgi:hypothetical protein